MSNLVSYTLSEQQFIHQLLVSLMNMLASIFDLIHQFFEAIGEQL
jgi:hypothetical protein